MPRRGKGRQVQRIEEARGRREHGTDTVDHDRIRGQVALQAPLDRCVDRWVGIDRDAVTGMACTHRHREVQGYKRGGIAEASTDLMESEYPRVGADDRIDRFLDPVQRARERMGNHGDRLRQPDVADRPHRDTCAECVRGKPHADLPLERKTAPCDIDDALDDHTPDIRARGREDHRQQIHHKPRIHPQPHHDCATRAGQRIQGGRLGRKVVPGERQLLTRRNHRQAGIDQRKQLGEDLGKTRLRAVEDDVSAGGHDISGTRSDDDVWWRSGDQRRSGLSRLRRVDVHSGHEVVTAPQRERCDFNPDRA